MNTPFQYSVRINIDDKAVDYLLTIDETGHVYEAKPLIFDLPEATQKLFLGKSDGQLKRKIDAFAKLSYYLLPLALTGRMLAFQKELAPLVKDIKRRLADKKMQWRDLAAFATPGAIPSEVLNVFGTNNKPNIKQQSFWENIIYLLNIEKKGDRKRDGHAIASLAQSKPEAAIAFFQSVIPFLNHANQRTAFEQFSKIKSESIKRYLLKELAFPFTPVQVSTGILKALYGYPKGDQEIYEAVLRHHRNVSKRDHENFAASVRIMGQYPTIEARDLVFGILRLDNRQSAAPACAALLNMGTPPKEIAKDLLPSLRAAMPNRSEAAFHVFAKFDQLREYLPDAVEMLDILVKTLLQFSNIPLGLPALAYKAGVYELNDNIYELLNHESPVVRRGLLFLIASVVFRESGFNPNPYHTPKMLKRYLILINDTDEEVAKAAVRLLGDIGLKRDGSQFIEPLVTLYKKSHQKTPLRILILEAINRCMHRPAYITKSTSLYMAFRHILEPLFIKILEEESDADLKAGALRGLSYHPEEDFKKAFTKYENDPDPKVARAAKQIFDLHYEIRWGKLRKKKPNLLKKIFKKGFRKN